MELPKEFKIMSEILKRTKGAEAAKTEELKSGEENLLKGVPPELVEKFGEENLKKIIEYIEKEGKKLKEESDWRKEEHGGYLSAARLDAIYRVVKGKNLFDDPKEREIISHEEEENFYRYARKKVVEGRRVAVEHLIRTGEKLGTPQQKNIIIKFLRTEIYSAAKDGTTHTSSGDVLGEVGELAALYRVFTGKPFEQILESIKDNKITKEIILKGLEDKIKKFINLEYYVVDGIVMYRILTAKKIDIIPGEGIVFPEDGEK